MVTSTSLSHWTPSSLHNLLTLNLTLLGIKDYNISLRMTDDLRMRAQWQQWRNMPRWWPEYQWNKVTDWLSRYIHTCDNSNICITQLKFISCSSLSLLGNVYRGHRSYGNRSDCSQYCRQDPALPGPWFSQGQYSDIGLSILCINYRPV